MYALAEMDLICVYDGGGWQVVCAANGGQLYITDANAKVGLPIEPAVFGALVTADGMDIDHPVLITAWELFGGGVA